ncbi:MAG: hypothetical protein ACOC22_00765 [bacterium]
MDNWHKLEFILNHKEGISPLELEQMEFYRVELFIQHFEEQIDKEREEQKKQEREQKSQEKSFNTSKMIKQAQRNMGNIKPPSIPNIPKK